MGVFKHSGLVLGSLHGDPAILSPCYVPLVFGNYHVSRSMGAWRIKPDSGHAMQRQQGRKRLWKSRHQGLIFGSLVHLADQDYERDYGP